MEKMREIQRERDYRLFMRKNLKIIKGFFKHGESLIFTRYKLNKNTKDFDHKSIIDYFIELD